MRRYFLLVAGMRQREARVKKGDRALKCQMSNSIFYSSTADMMRRSAQSEEGSAEAAEAAAAGAGSMAAEDQPTV